MSVLGQDKSPQAFRTITEAADELDVPAHVLRFWEGKFSQLRPLKRAGGRRLYRADDMALLRGIRALLHEDGYQLKGVQKLFKDQGVAWVRERGGGALLAASIPTPAPLAPEAFDETHAGDGEGAHGAEPDFSFARRQTTASFAASAPEAKVPVGTEPVATGRLGATIGPDAHPHASHQANPDERARVSASGHAVGILLRQALVKLERARGLLDRVATQSGQ